VRAAGKHRWRSTPHGTCLLSVSVVVVSDPLSLVQNDESGAHAAATAALRALPVTSPADRTAAADMTVVSCAVALAAYLELRQGRSVAAAALLRSRRPLPPLLPERS
jgi:hypothetical protein